HRRAAESDVLIVNHHLFFADLALKQTEYASLLPEYSAIVFDEAHDMEDVATKYFGIQVSNYRIEELARDTESTLRLKAVESPAVNLSLGALRQRARRFFELFLDGERRAPFVPRSSFIAVPRGHYHA